MFRHKARASLARDVLIASGLIDVAIQLVHHTHKLAQAGYLEGALPAELDKIRGLLRGAYDSLGFDVSWDVMLTECLASEERQQWYEAPQESATRSLKAVGRRRR